MKRWRRSRSDGGLFGPSSSDPSSSSKAADAASQQALRAERFLAKQSSSRDLDASEFPSALPTLLGKSNILTSAELIRGIQQTLPRTLLEHNWRLLYSVQTHGANFGTFYTRARNDAFTLLIIETSRGDVFGGFASQPWRPSGEYYGTGESYLFSVDDAAGTRHDSTAKLLTETFGGAENVPVVRPVDDATAAQLNQANRKRRPRHPSARGTVVDVVKANDPKLYEAFVVVAPPARQKSDVSSSNSDDFDIRRAALRTNAQQNHMKLPPKKPRHVRKYPWSGANSYFIVCTDSSIAMGGGGDWGLLIDDHFSRGATGRSDTYANHPLCSSSEFDVVNLECWGFTTAATLREEAAKYRTGPAITGPNGVPLYVGGHHRATSNDRRLIV